MSKRGTYKYICDDCKAENWLSARERTSRFRAKCSSCGSTYLNPSDRSKGPEKIFEANEACKVSHNIFHKKMGKIK